MLLSVKKNKHTVEGKALYFGFAYSKPVRAEFDKYMMIISDSLKFTNPLLVKSSYGSHAGIIFRRGNGKFEAGGSYAFGITANNSTTANLATNTFDIHFGYSQYIAGRS